ncbi:hypothetical protein [Rhizobium johnstonii]|uniref:hypothetical protein n=1 Tax=Rhizobium johnstonii TaxID=3019933 RepID=UPI002DDD14C1|nr:hypothetical protein U8P72_11530 [Rhizobium johnstonii]
MAAHIYLDHILTETLRDRIPDIDVYLKSGHKTFADKLALCQAHRVVDEELVATLKALNRARNQFAHRLDFEVTDELKMQLFTQFSPTRAKADVLGDEGFTNFLLTVIMLLEFERIYEFKSAPCRRRLNFIGTRRSRSLPERIALDGRRSNRRRHGFDDDPKFPVDIFNFVHILFPMIKLHRISRIR